MPTKPQFKVFPDLTGLLLSATVGPGTCTKSEIPNRTSISAAASTLFLRLTEVLEVRPNHASRHRYQQTFRPMHDFEPRRGGLLAKNIDNGRLDESRLRVGMIAVKLPTV